MFSKKRIQCVYPTLTNFTQRKKKPYDANALSALSLVSIVVYIYSVGKIFHCTCLKTTEHEMILSHANVKMGENLVKICKERKHTWVGSQHF